jgi:hypothetical protein
MANIFGALGFNDTDRVFASTTGQTQVWDFIQDHVNRYNADLAAASAILVEGQTEAFKTRYYLPGTGRMPKKGNSSPAAAIKRSGSWDVAYPLEGYGDEIAGDRVSMAYMTARELENHILTVQQRDTNARRFAILSALLNKTNLTFQDETHGALTVNRLANADGTIYPPVLGSESETTSHSHYAGTNYATASISDTNDPYVTGMNHLEEHFGAPSGGGMVVAFINNAETAKTTALTEFTDLPGVYTASGANTPIPANIPANLPGRTLGVHNRGVIVQEWRWIPATYMLFVHLDAPAPLMERVDPADTGLPRGLALISDSPEAPWRRAIWEDRFGFGVGNRLNGVALQLTASTTYTTPTGY